MEIRYDTVEVYPTNLCQLKCKGCYLHNGDMEWSEKLAQDLVFKSGFFERIDKEILILGGEPTTWIHLLDFTREIRKLNPTVKIIITTNAIRFTTDEAYLKEFIRDCSIDNVKVYVSWHSNTNIINPILKLKKAGILEGVIFVPNSISTIPQLEEMFIKLSSLCPCYWRPFIIPDKTQAETSEEIANFLSKQPTKNVQSYDRLVDGSIVSNIELIHKNNEDSFSYKDYNCKCGKNTVLYVDGKLYNCLAQAITGHNPIPLNTSEQQLWKKCSYDFCCCDTFELKSNKDF